MTEHGGRTTNQDQIAQRLARAAVGTCEANIEKIISQADLEGQIDEEEAEALIAEGGVERCSYCDWYFELHELRLVNEQYVCPDCLKERQRE